MLRMIGICDSKPFDLLTPCKYGAMFPVFSTAKVAHALAEEYGGLGDTNEKESGTT